MMEKEPERKDVLKKTENELENSTLDELDDNELEEVSGGGLYEDYPEYYDASETNSHSKRKKGLLAMSPLNGG